MSAQHPVPSSALSSSPPRPTEILHLPPPLDSFVMRIPFTPYVQTIKAEPHAPVVKPESYLRVKSEPLESAIKLERYERATKSEPYESMKFEHTPSPPLPSFIKCFPICYENKTSIEMDALLLSSGRQVLKGIPSLDATTIQACGFSEIKLSIFVRPPLIVPCGVCGWQR